MEFMVIKSASHNYTFFPYNTVYPRSGYPFYMVGYYVNWVTTSWTDSILLKTSEENTRDEDPDPVLFSTDPDPTCNNGFIKLFSFLTKYKQESTSLK